MQFGGNNNNGGMDGYVQAVHNVLQNVLNQLVNNQVISVQDGHSVANSVDNWVGQFVQQYQGRSNVYEKDVAADLYDAIGATAGGGQNNNQQFGNQPVNTNQVMNAMQRMHQGGSNSFYNNSGGNMIGQNNTMYDNGGRQEVRFDNGASEYSPSNNNNAAPVDNRSVEVTFTEYEAPTAQPEEAVLFTSDTTTVKVLRYPANGNNVAFDDYRISTCMPVASFGDMLGLVNMVIGNTEVPYMATIQYNKTQKLDIDPTTYVEHLTHIQEMFDGKDNFTIADIAAVYKVLDGLPRNIYAAYERFIVDKFNKALASRTMHNKDCATTPISVKSLENVLLFNPELNDSRLTAITGSQFFARAMNAVANNIIKGLCSIEMTSSALHIASALKAETNAANLDMYGKLCLEDENVRAELFKGKSYITYTDVVHVTNMDPTESRLLMTAAKDGVATFDKSTMKFTSPLEYMISKLFSSNGGGDKLLCASGDVFHYGYTCDSGLFAVSH